MIALCVRDCENHIEKVKRNIDNIRSFVSDTRVVFVESDSSDNTLSVLKESFANDALVISAGNLQSKLPERTQRISHCRNLYLDEAEKSDFDYLLVIDGDDVGEEMIDEPSLSSNFEYEKWDMMTSNQPEAYYDLWALRHETWMPFDCWEEYEKSPTRENFIRCVTSRFMKIDESADLIKVQSAFGGSAVIRVDSVRGIRHVGLKDNGSKICEWVPFCQQLNDVYINPKFVNSRILNNHVIANLRMIQ